MFWNSAIDLFDWLRPFLAFLVGGVALVGGTYFFWKKAKEEHFPLPESLDALIRASVLSLLVARAAYILFHWSQFWGDWRAWWHVTAYPGLWSPLGLVVFFAWMYRWGEEQKLDTWEVWDFVSIMLSWFFAWYWLTRLILGVSAGLPTTLPWGMIFLHRVEPAHPVPIYAALGFATLFTYLWWAEPRYRFFIWYRSKKHTAKTGYLFSVWCLGLGLIGLGLSLVQYPFYLIFDWDINQIIYLVTALSGLVLLYIRSGRTFFLTKKERTSPFANP